MFRPHASLIICNLNPSCIFKSKRKPPFGPRLCFPVFCRELCSFPGSGTTAASFNPSYLLISVCPWVCYGCGGWKCSFQTPLVSSLMRMSSSSEGGGKTEWEHSDHLRFYQTVYRLSLKFVNGNVSVGRRLWFVLVRLWEKSPPIFSLCTMKMQSFLVKFKLACLPSYQRQVRRDSGLMQDKVLAGSDPNTSKDKSASTCFKLLLLS